MATHALPEVLLVDGEPVAGLELPRHVVPAPLRTRRVLATDLPSLRASLDGHVVAALVDGRADPASAARAIAALRSLPGGAELPILVLVLGEGGATLREEPRVDVVAHPFTLSAIHARLLLLAGSSVRSPEPERLRSA